GKGSGRFMGHRGRNGRPTQPSHTAFVASGVEQNYIYSEETPRVKPEMGLIPLARWQSRAIDVVSGLRGMICKREEFSQTVFPKWKVGLVPSRVTTPVAARWKRAATGVEPK